MTAIDVGNFEGRTHQSDDSSWPEGLERGPSCLRPKLRHKLPVVKRPACNRGGPTGVRVAR
jgi:hypothetical protein